MRDVLGKLCLPVLFIAVVGVSVAAAETVTIEASADVWIREYDPDSTYEGDGVSVGGTGTIAADNNLRRYGLVEFDISTVAGPIVGAHVELYAINYAANSSGLSQQAGLLVPEGIGSTTWNNLWTTKTEVTLQSLGYMEIAADSPMDAWYSSNAASAADLANLNSLLGGSGKVTMLFGSSGGRHEWGGGEASLAPRLVVETAVPEPSAMFMVTAGVFGMLAYAWRRRR